MVRSRLCETRRSLKMRKSRTFWSLEKARIENRRYPARRFFHTLLSRDFGWHTRWIYILYRFARIGKGSYGLFQPDDDWQWYPRIYGQSDGLRGVLGYAHVGFWSHAKDIDRGSALFRLYTITAADAAGVECHRCCWFDSLFSWHTRCRQMGFRIIMLCVRCLQILLCFLFLNDPVHSCLLHSYSRICRLKIQISMHITQTALLARVSDFS